MTQVSNLLLNILIALLFPQNGGVTQGSSPIYHQELAKKLLEQEKVQPDFSSISLPAETPESALRRLLYATAKQDRKAIGIHSLYHPEQDILLQQKAQTTTELKTLKKTLDQIELKSLAVGDSFAVGPKRVVVTDDMVDSKTKLIMSENDPLPVRVKKIGQHWKVDLTQLIRARKRAHKLRAIESDGASEDEREMFSTIKKSGSKQVKKDVAVMFDALQNSKANEVLKFTHPIVIEEMDGFENAVAATSEQFVQWETSGLNFESLKVAAEPKFVESNYLFYVVVPTDTVVSVKDQRFLIKGFHFGVRSKYKSAWTYIDGKTIARVGPQSLFPDFPEDFKLPELSTIKLN